MFGQFLTGLRLTTSIVIGADPQSTIDALKASSTMSSSSMDESVKVNIQNKANSMDIVKDAKPAMKDAEESYVKTEVKPDITLSHQELVKLTKTTIDNLVEREPLFSGLPSDVTVEELKSQIAVAQGQAITLFLNRGELPKLAVVVPPHNTTVLDLKKAIKRHMNLALKRENVKKKISWKHIWKKYHLCFEDTRLSNDNENIKAYGITNKMELHFTKRRREKNKLIKS